MSFKAVLWALEIAPVKDPTTALVLVGLCERANDDGRGSWPTLDWLAGVSRVSRSNVKRHLAALQDAGLIAPMDSSEDPRWLRQRPDRRPRVWAIAAPSIAAPGGLTGAYRQAVVTGARGPTGRPSSQGHGGLPVDPRGPTGAQNGGLPVGPRHIEEEPEENPNREPERAGAGDAPPPPDDLAARRAARAARGVAELRAAIRRPEPS